MGGWLKEFLGVVSLSATCEISLSCSEEGSLCALVSQIGFLGGVIECNLSQNRHFISTIGDFSISEYQELSEGFIKKYQDKVIWYCVVKGQKLSEEFTEKFQNKLEWRYILIYQKLSERFIEKYKDKVDWRDVVKYQNLSGEFIEFTENGFGLYSKRHYRKIKL